MFGLFRKLWHSRKAISGPEAAGLAVAVLIAGILLPVGLEAWLSYVPTDPTLALIWPLGAVLVVLGIVMKFYNDTRT